MTITRRTARAFRLRAPMRAALSAGVCLALASSASRSEAQTMPGTHGFAVSRFDPAPAGDAFHGVDFSRYSNGRTFGVRFGILGDYAYQPLVGRDSTGAVRPIIDHRVDLHVLATVALLDRFDINLAMPIQLLETGPNDIAGTMLRASNGVAAGDLRAGLRVRIFNHADRNAFSLHAGAQLYLGGLWSSTLSNASDGGIRVRGYLNAAGRISLLRYSAQIGAVYRPSNQLDTRMPPHSVGPELVANAALGLVFLRDQLMIGAEFYSAARLTSFGQADTGSFAAEANLGVHYTIADLVRVGVSAGPGFSQAPGTPTVRALLNVAYAPIERAAPAGPTDTDLDGVPDADDQCVEVPQGEHPNPARRGCPLGDRDSDGVFDTDDQCVEVPQGEHPDPNRRGCPLADRDRDGVFDNDDQCPDTPQGDHPDPNRRGCPDGDDDSDRVLNSQDVCRNEPAGLNPDPARPGCPTPDRDRDTVPDPVDHCPDQPGAPHPDPQRNGCPGMVAVQDGMLRITRPVFFATSRDTILPRSFPVLTAVRDALAASPQIRRVSVEGHTDDQGNDARNMDLSIRRAASVVRWLTAHGIDGARLESHGFGEERPMTPITGLRGRPLNAARAQNRRVEFRIVP